MRAVRITATLTQTAALGVVGRSDFRQDTYDHVPGSVLRGALASTWLRTPGTPGPEDAVFRDVFEGDGAFGPLHSVESLPLPLSTWTHKSEPSALCTMSSWDELDGPVPPRCPVCPSSKGKLERSKGQATGRPSVGSRSRVALTDTGVAADGQLFRRAALDAGTELTGWVSGPAVDAVFPAGNAVTSLRFGGERSIRGLAQIAVTEVAPQPLTMNGTRLVLRLASPGVFIDRLGRPADKPLPSELAAVLDVKVKIAHALTRWTEVGGWHMASGLPKPRDRAVVAGSTYVIDCVEVPAPERLAVLAARGIGLRRREGFGALYNLGSAAAEQSLSSPSLIAMVAPILSWPDWAAYERLLRALPERPIPADSPRRRKLKDRWFTDHEPQRRALEVLLDLPDSATLLRLLDELGSL